MDKWKLYFLVFSKVSKYFTKDGELVCDIVYFNPFANYNQWYTPYEYENWGDTIFRMNTVISTKVKVKSINDVALPTRASDHVRGDTTS